MKIGDTVYTINAKTNTIDDWILDGFINTPEEPFCQLTKGSKFCALPKRCVFKDKDQALKVLSK